MAFVHTVQGLHAATPRPEVLIAILLAALSGGMMGFLVGLAAALIF